MKARRWDNQWGPSAGEVAAYSAGVFLIALGRLIAKGGKR